MPLSSLADKKILMFAPKFFGYRESIAEQIRSFGACVDLYDERPGNSAFAKTMVRYNIKLYYPAVMKYYTGIIEQNRDKDYDYIFVISGEAFNKDVAAKFKQAYPNARFILYQWDSLANIPDGVAKLALYDRILTFDPVDAKQYNMILRPLFFRKEYEKRVQPKDHYTYEVAFIGTAHTIRPRVMKQLEKQCGPCYSYLFLPHPLVFLYNKILNPAYKHIKKTDIHFTSISPAHIQAVYAESRCILDVEHEKQNGLTMRTIEMIGSNKKLITTNTTIQTYDFYDPNNICIIDRDDPCVPEEFRTSPYRPIPDEILQRYSLRAFVQDIFDIKE